MANNPSKKPTSNKKSEQTQKQNPKQEEIWENTLRAFDLYSSAVRCILISLCPDRTSYPHPEEELPKLREAVDRFRLPRVWNTGGGGYSAAKRRSSLEEIDLALKPGTELIHSIGALFTLIEMAAERLPPRRRVDWVLRWNNIELLFDYDVKERIADEAPEDWKELQMESQTRERKSELYSYFLEDLPRNHGFKTFRQFELGRILESIKRDKIPPEEYEEYFEDAAAVRQSWTYEAVYDPDGKRRYGDIWLWRFDKYKLSYEIEFGCLAREYCTAMEEWAYLCFARKAWNEEKIKRADCSEDSEYLSKSSREWHIQEHALRCFGDINDFIRVDWSNFLEFSGLDDTAELEIPQPESFKTMEQWVEVCTKAGGPIEKANEWVVELEEYMEDRFHAENFEKRKAEKQEASVSEPEPKSRREPYTSIECKILRALMCKALTGEALLEAIGKGASNIQWLSKLVGPRSRLRTEGPVRHKRRRGYYREDYPPDDL